MAPAADRAYNYKSSTQQSSQNIVSQQATTEIATTDTNARVWLYSAYNLSKEVHHTGSKIHASEPYALKHDLTYTFI